MDKTTRLSYNTRMSLTRLIGVLAIILGVGFVMYIALPQTRNWIPSVGKASLNNQDGENLANVTPVLEIFDVFGYRSSPQYYNVGLDQVDIKAIVNNNTNQTTTERFELKVYKFNELWDTKNHAITYDQRAAYVNAAPKQEMHAFTEEELRNIVDSRARCRGESGENSYTAPCYHDTNPEDNNHSYGGYVLQSKPIHVQISDDIQVEANNRQTVDMSWKPQTCGYFQIVFRSFGLQADDPALAYQDKAYVRVRGCDTGTILENGAVAASVATNGTLPGTALGWEWFFIPGFGLILGGIMIHLGTRNFSI